MGRQTKKGSSETNTSGGNKTLGLCRCSLRTVFCLVLLLVVAACTVALAVLRSSSDKASNSGVGIESSRGPPEDSFGSTAVPLVRRFIASRYKDYGEGKVTLKHLKKHIVAKSGLGLTYEDLRDDRYSAVIEDEVDAIVNRCDGGKKPVACVGADALQSEL
eukprot:TRINITY_DN61460_c0_g1_i1.p1 TRINITY_DN61460_c0_g1~~TRINITY_DN61460_c0_g1_i1.p1  ORF type:complete len:178 (+),score=25.45 TRINITY_DN61460_c0_g1_i1:53-535(+)